MIKSNFHSIYLPKYELFFYFNIYFIFLLCSFYKIYMLSDEIIAKSSYDGFTSGWKYLNRKRDNVDFEWEAWKTFIGNNIIWFTLHIIVSEVVYNYKKHAVSIAHTIIGALFIWYRFGIIVLIIMIVKNLTFLHLMSYGQKSLIWFNASIWLILINIFKYETTNQFLTSYGFHLNIDEDRIYEAIVIIAWSLLKSMSFTLDKIESENRYKDSTNEFKIEYFFGYSFYLPTIYLGPFMIYERYKNMIILDKRINFQKRLMELIENLGICLLWILVTDFGLHYIYINNLTYNPNIVIKLDPWPLYGMGYLMGQFFHMKYVVVYGFGIALSKMDQIETPDKPKCIGRIHLYSNMWKYFDQGLYEFLFIYIYKSLTTKTSSNLRRLISSFITFFFIYLWHGFYKFILIWSILNYLCLIIENISKSISKTQKYQQFIERTFSKNNEMRLIAFLGSQLFIPAALSNFYFFADVEVGNIFIYRTYTSGIIIYIFLTFCCICIYHTAEFVTRLERMNKNQFEIKK